MKYFLLILFTIFVSTAGAQEIKTPQLVYDIYPGLGGSDPTFITPFNGKLYFLANDSIHGREPWAYDSVQHPAMLYDVYTGSGSSLPLDIHLYNYKMGILNNTLYFPAGNGKNTTSLGGYNGVALYKYDGTSLPSWAADVDTPYDFTTFDNKLFFDAIVAGHGPELYAFDGTHPPKYYEVNPLKGGSYPNNLFVYNNKLYFSATTDPYGFELYVYDAARDTVSMVQDIAVGNNSSYPGHFMVLDGIMYFTASTYFNGIELYSYDGKSITRLTDLAPGQASGISSHSELAAYNGAIYFGGSTDGESFQLYKYIPGGTSFPGKSLPTLVYTLNKSGDADPYHFTVYNNRLYFTATDTTNGCEMWVHDGTNTKLVADLYPGSYSSLPSDLTVWNNSLYFNATDGISGYELYRLYDTDKIQKVIVNPIANTLYPNPTNNDSYIEINTPATEKLLVRIMDISGRAVYNSALQTTQGNSNIYIIPMHLFPSGTYYYHLHNESGRLYASGKIVRI